MSKRLQDQIRVQRRSWHDKQTGYSNDIIVITRGNIFIRVPFSQARQLVDQVHDLCDERDREIREARSQREGRP